MVHRFRLTKEKQDTEQMNLYRENGTALKVMVLKKSLLGDEENKEQDIFDLDCLANIDKINQTPKFNYFKTIAKAIGEMRGSIDSGIGSLKDASSG